MYSFLRGGAGLAVAVPRTVKLGPIGLDRLDLAVQIAAAPAAQARLTGGLVLGPLSATVDGIGAAAVFAFRQGNLGPGRSGRAVPAAAWARAGHGRRPAPGGRLHRLRRDHGPLQRRAGPAGRRHRDHRAWAPGHAAARWQARVRHAGRLLQGQFPPIQVGFGLALEGIGGLIGLNRRLDVDALRPRFASGAAGRILAPEDPIRNAPVLLAELDLTFPVTEGATIVGPTLQMSWIALVRVDLGIFLELPGRRRLAAAGGDQRAGTRSRYDVEPSVDMYPAPGDSTDFAFSRNLVPGTPRPLISFCIECGSDRDLEGGFQPPVFSFPKIEREVQLALLALLAYAAAQPKP